MESNAEQPDEETVPDDPLFLWDDAADADGAEPDAAVPWRVLVVDDDKDVHQLTRFVLGGFAFEERPLELLFASSRHEAEGILAATPDIAVALLDVVMEEEDAGLRLVRFIREELGNHGLRIILRTGYPGLAPENKVIVEYDINDYKAKTELTAQRLTVSMTVALRSYRDIMQIEANRRGLERILAASTALFGHRMIGDFAAEAVRRIDDLLQLDDTAGSILCVARSFGAGEADYAVLAASGPFAGSVGARLSESVPPAVAEIIRNAHRPDLVAPSADRSVSYFDFSPHQVIVSYVQAKRPLSELDRRLLDILCGKIASGLANVQLLERMVGLQKGVVLALARIADYKSAQGVRLERLVMALIRQLRASGTFPELDAEELAGCIGFASLLRDVGMVSVPDAVLAKSGALSAEERAQIQRHTTVGRDILNEVALAIDGPSYLQTAAECAENHHEWFDGSGYPHGLAGEQIPLSARIVAVADVFGALTAPRPHRPAWPTDKAAAYVEQMAGRQFDPRIVKTFLAMLAEGGPAEPSDDFARALLR